MFFFAIVSSGFNILDSDSCNNNFMFFCTRDCVRDVNGSHARLGPTGQHRICGWLVGLVA